MDKSILKRVGQWLAKQADEGGLLQYGKSRASIPGFSFDILSEPAKIEGELRPSGTIVARHGSTVYPVHRYQARNVKPVGLTTSPDVGLWARYAIPGNEELWKIDALGSKAGEGAGSTLYPAIGQLAHDTGVKIIPDVLLTHENIPARSLNSIGAELRARGTPVFVPHEMQLSGSGLGIDDFLALPYDQRAAALALQGTGIKRNQLMEAFDRADFHDSPGLKALMSQYGIRPSRDTFGMLEDITEPRETFMDAARKLHALDIDELKPGERTLRMQAVMPAVVENQDVPPELVKGLFKREGGLAQIRRTRPRRSSSAAGK